MGKFLLGLVAFLVVGGCSAAAPRTASSPTLATGEQGGSVPTAENRQRGGGAGQQQKDGKFYLDDGPPDDDFDLSRVKWVTVKDEPIRRANTRPYVALGKRFTPYKTRVAYRQRGVASWYGKRYHGRQTASGEVYDMYAMSAAHPILPIPSYVRVTRVATGKSVTVRINDRGPFLAGREIDLSYAAAAILGYTKDGTTEVMVETILPNGDSAPAVSGSASGVVDVPKPPPRIVEETKVDDFIYIQLAVFSHRYSAQQMVSELKQTIPAKFHPHLVINSLASDLFAVHIGPYAQREQAVADDQLLCRDFQHCGFLKRHAPR